MTNLLKAFYALPRRIIVLALIGCLSTVFGASFTYSQAVGKVTKATATAKQTPQRIVSLDFCTDLTLLLIAPPQRIAALTQRSFDPQFSPLARQAQSFESHTGSIEEIIRLKPDLILAGDSDADLIHSLKQLNYPVVSLKPTRHLAGIAGRTRELGKLTGTEIQASALITEFQQLMRATKKSVTDRSKRALIYAPNGSTYGAGTFKNEVLNHIGLRNTAAERGIENQGYLGVEQLLRAQPDFLLIDDATRNKNSLAQQFSAHPALRGLNNTKLINVHSGLWDCATPLVAKLAKQIADN